MRWGAAPADFGIGVDETRRISELAGKWEQTLDGNLKAQAAARAAVGITVFSARGAKGNGTAAEIVSWPVGELDMREALAHTIRFRDSVLGRKRPAGVVGCELWLQKLVPDAKGAEDDFKMAGVSLGFKHRVEFGKEHAGQRMIYQMRWMMRKGVKGRWSPVVSGVVIG